MQSVIFAIKRLQISISSRLATIPLDFGVLFTLNLAFLGFSINGIYTGLAILPFYDFISTPAYGIACILIVALSALISFGIYKRVFGVVLIGLGLQWIVASNVILDRLVFEPKYLQLMQDPIVFNLVYGKLPTSFYVAPWYELVDVLTFVFFIAGCLLLLVRLFISLGIARGFLITLLIGSGFLLYFEYVTINLNVRGVSVQWIENERLTNFSNNWPLIGQINNIQFLWICLIIFGTSLALGLIFALGPRMRKYPFRF